jgi:hypothetical protein
VSADSDGGRGDGAVRVNLDTRLLDLYHAMARIRTFEEAGVAAQKQGLALGAIRADDPVV